VSGEPVRDFSCRSRWVNARHSGPWSMFVSSRTSPQSSQMRSPRSLLMRDSDPHSGQCCWRVSCSADYSAFFNASRWRVFSDIIVCRWEKPRPDRETSPDRTTCSMLVHSGIKSLPTDHREPEPGRDPGHRGPIVTSLLVVPTYGMRGAYRRPVQGNWC